MFFLEILSFVFAIVSRGFYRGFYHRGPTALGMHQLCPNTVATSSVMQSTGPAFATGQRCPTFVHGFSLCNGSKYSSIPSIHVWNFSENSPNSFSCRGSHGLAKGPCLVRGCVGGCQGAFLFVIYNTLGHLPSKTYSKIEN